MKPSGQDEINYLDFFRGGVPAGAIFYMNLGGLRELVKKRFKLRAHFSVQSEVCLIGVVSYFEAFCGDHFASILNICPQLLVRLKKNGRDVSLDATDLLEVGLQSTHIGSIVAERYDFGTPQSINSLYQHLLQITPFSTQERKRYEQILNDRNLLVHHGGISTMKYSKQSSLVAKSVHYDSISVSQADFLEVAGFLESIVHKTVKASHARLVEFMEQQPISPSKVQEKAIHALLWVD